MEPQEALRRIGFLLERQQSPTYRVKAYRGAADALDALSADEVARLVADGSITSIKGIGAKTAQVITEAVGGGVPEYLTKLEGENTEPVVAGGARIRALLRGDLHTHSEESDGGSPIEEMARTARDLGHEYVLLTDHSPRLTVANGLSTSRLRDQIDRVRALDKELAPFRLLAGIEVDIHEDGSLDQSDELLEELDVVVASVHSKLRMGSDDMTARMVGAIANRHMNVLGHCTGRLVTGGRGTRPESTFDPEIVFEACRQFNVAVEINSRPERLDPPRRLLKIAVEAGCLFSIDTDAHAPGQLDWQVYGCARAEECGVPPERIVNTWPVGTLLEWARTRTSPL